jgi:hypothetical protein
MVETIFFVTAAGHSGQIIIISAFDIFNPGLDQLI